MKAFQSDRRGGVATTAAVLLLTLIVGVGAAVNAARLNSTGNELQDLADAAALAAALELRDGKEDAAAAARVDALSRPMVAALEGSRPAALQLAVNSRNPVDVTVSGAQPFAVTFAGALGLDEMLVRRTARAVVDASAPVCLLLLERSAPRAWSMAGSPSVSGGDCVAQVNSSASGAIADQGAASASVMATHVVGPPSPLRRFQPTPTFNQTPLADPYAGRLSWPSPSTPCAADKQNVTVSHGARTLRPGVYCGGLSFGAGARATLAAGVYVLKTGGLDLKANAVASGAGVTIVLLDPAAGLQMGGNSTLRLTAPEQGPWRGIAIAQRADATGGTHLGGSSQLDLKGLLYLPGQALEMTGSARIGGSAAPRAVVARQLRMQGNPDLKLAAGDALAGRPGTVRLAAD